MEFYAFAATLAVLFAIFVLVISLITRSQIKKAKETVNEDILNSYKENLVNQLSISCRVMYSCPLNRGEANNDDVSIPLYATNYETIRAVSETLFCYCKKTETTVHLSSVVQDEVSVYKLFGYVCYLHSHVSKNSEIIETLYNVYSNYLLPSISDLDRLLVNEFFYHFRHVYVKRTDTRESEESLDVLFKFV